MSIKIVAFGQNEHTTKFVQKSKGAPNAVSQEAVIVDNISMAQNNFLLFSVKERALVSAQATGSNGLLFFLGGDTPLFEQKQFLIDLLSSQTQFDGIPIAVIFQRGQQLTLKDVVNYMELYRLKDRASMIKQISWDQQDWITEVYGWVKVQSEQSKGKGFQAAPKVIKMKAKYREDVDDQSQKKYAGMLDEKEVQVLGVKQQEDIYIEREKEKLKKENMEKQLSMFSRNKKKMSPYDIKPTPNPKIDANLHFFLKDPHSQPAPEVSIKIQTDEFKDRPIPPPYKPKKTGINTSTQIQENQLFNFDKEVRPILAILTTKALENAALEIEEEQELVKMVKYKKTYQDKVRKQKDHQQKNIDEELRVIKEKQKLLKEHREKIEMKKNIQQRAQCYQLANKFLSGIYSQTSNRLISAKVFPDSLCNFLKTDYLDQIISKAATKYDSICKSKTVLMGVFEKDVVDPVKGMASSVKESHEKMKKKREARLINQSATTRKVHILYKHEYLQFSNFSKYLAKHFNGTIEEHSRVREEQIQQISDKISSSQATEQDLFKAKLKDSQDFADAGHQNFLLQNRQICFTSTSNKYQKTKEVCIENGILLLDKDGQLIEQPAFGNLSAKLDFLRVETQLREKRQSINMDEGIVIDLSKVPEKVKSIILLAKVPEVQKFKVETQMKKIKHACYGMQFSHHRIPIHSKNIGETVKWQEVAKAAQGEDVPSQHTIVVAYVIRRRVIPEFWTLQDVSYVSQPYKTQEELNIFFQQISKFYYRSNDFLKEEEEEQKVERPATSSQQKKSSSRQVSRGRSKKVIEEPKKKTVLKVTTKILNEVTVGLNQPIEDILKKLTGSVQEWKDFIESCENGWVLQLKGKKVNQTSQLTCFKKVGDIILKRVPKPEQPKIEKIQEQQGQKVQEQA